MRRLAVVLVGVLMLSGTMAVIFSGELTPRVAPPNPPPPEGPVLWSADTETGDLSQWTQGQFDEAVFNTGTGDITITDNTAHSGTQSLRMSITQASGETQAARILRWHDTPAEGYYSVWFQFPRQYKPAQWWNVLQFKSVAAENVPAWVLNVGNRNDGSMFFYLWDALSSRSYEPLHAVNIPVGEWFQVKVYLRRATDRTGRITIWQDGVLLFDIDQVRTAVGDNIHFGIGNYTDDIDPPDPVIYADDAKIRSVISAGQSDASNARSIP